MAGVLRAAGVPPEKITAILRNWAPRALSPQPPVPPMTSAPLGVSSRKFVALYSGNLGRVHDLTPPLTLRNSSFPTEKSHSSSSAPVPNAPLSRPKPPAATCPTCTSNLPSRARQLARSLALGDLHLVTMRPGCETAVFPSKL